MYNPFLLFGKTILITGASSGIGRETAIEVSRLGANVVITGRDHSRLSETFSNLDQESGQQHLQIISDLSNEESLVELINELPLLDGCVNNAGMGKMTPIQFLSSEDLTRVFTLNCFSPMLLTKHLLRKKKLKKGASLVFTSSIAGFSNVSPANAIYGSSKNALNAYVKYAALELAGKGIRCNAVHPGRVNTPLIENRLMSEEDVKRDLEFYPLKRYGEPREVAYAIIYLLSDASAWVTGSNLVIDGGRSLK